MSPPPGRLPPSALLVGLLCALGTSAVGIQLMQRGTLGGGVATLSGLALFAVVYRRANGSERLEADELAVIRRTVPWAVLGLTGLVLWSTVVLAVAHPDREQRVLGMPTAHAWPLSLLLVTAGALRISPRRLAEWIVARAGAFRSNRAEIAGVAATVLAALLIRVHALDAHPYPWSGDEASVGSAARHLLHGDIPNLFSAGWSLQPHWSFVPTALAFVLWGDSMYAIRMVAVVIGTASVLASYLLARALFGPREAALSSIFLATFPYHVHFSRLGVSNIVDSLSAPLLLWLTVRAASVRRVEAWWLAGMAAGLVFYSYPGSRLVLLFVLAVLLHAAVLRRRDPGRQWPEYAAFGVAATLVAGPMCVYFAKNPVIFHGRFSQTGIVQTGWLQAEAARTGHSPALVLLEQLWRSLSVYVATPAVGNFFNYPRPYLTPVASVLFLLGLGIAFAHVRTLRFMVLLLWFWAVVLIGGMLTMGPPANTRLVMTAPAVAMLVAVGLTSVSGVVVRTGLLSDRRAAACGLALIVALGAHGVFDYFGPYRRGRHFDDAHSELAMELGGALGSRPGSPELYLVTNGRVGVTVPTFDYLAPRSRKHDVRPSECDGVPVGPGIVVAALPEHEDCLRRIARRVPGAEVRAVPRKNGKEVLYYYLAERRDA